MHSCSAEPLGKKNGWVSMVLLGSLQQYFSFYSLICCKLPSLQVIEENPRFSLEMSSSETCSQA